MKFLIAFFFSLFTLCVHSNEGFNLADRIKTNDFYIAQYSKLFSKSFLTDEDFKEKFSKLSSSKRNKVLKLISSLESSFPDKLLKPIVYYATIEKNQTYLKEVLAYSMLNKILLLRDHLDNPLISNKADARTLYEKLSHDTSLSTDFSFEKSMPFILIQAESLSQITDIDAFIEGISQTEILSIKLNEKVSNIKPYLLSHLGLIPGNVVEVISKNEVSPDRIKWFNDRVIFSGGKLDIDAPYVMMPTAGNDSGHVTFQTDPIFIKIRDMITEAKESIFIDIFLFGGTLGATIAEYLLDQTIEKLKTNPNFKVLLLHDYATNYNMKDEMMPVFHYIKDRIERDNRFHGSAFLLQANIQRHPPGIPFGVTSLIPKTPEVFKRMEQKSTYFESKIDHSKVIVIDANTDSPSAYFGSKNWSDHSGGYYYDDAIYVKGPAAAAVQYSYYRDLEAALTTDEKELAWFYYKEDGFDNKHYLAQRDDILDFFKIKKDTYPLIGDQVVRIAEADVDGTIKNVRNILIDMIMNAEKNIYMEQLFIYDKYIVDALIKRKIQVPNLKIKILADHNGNFEMNGLPNTIFLKEMSKYGIEIRARKTLGIKAQFPNGDTKMYHQENHRKITSVDGKVLLGGSSNLNPDTLQGSFREFGAQIFDKDQISKFEKSFVQAWEDKDQTSHLDIENFQAKIGNNLLSVELSALLNNFAAQLLRSKDHLEKRH